jgi:phage baseplate assembly protein W
MPTFIVPGSSSGSATPANETEIDLFGVDVLFEDDLQVTGSADYATVEGYAALRQAILIRLITTPGEYAVRPDFGCGVAQWLKKRMTTSELDTLRQRIIEQLSQEERIQKVEEVSVESLSLAGTTGVKISVRVSALGRENSFSFTTFSD